MGAHQPPASGSPQRSAPSLERLLAWYDVHRRDLPWRALPGRRPDPYHVLLSELMLQQTTAATVSGRFAAFLARFPSLAALAAADEAAILHAWQGLGYYRRARALHALARAVTLRHGGILPQDEAALRALPGIGAWTADYVALRGLGDPDVLPAGDLVLRRAAAARGLPDAPADLARAARAWRPWRGYAAEHLWTAPHRGSEPPAPLPHRGPEPPTPLPDRGPWPPTPPAGGVSA